MRLRDGRARLTTEKVRLGPIRSNPALAIFPMIIPDREISRPSPPFSQTNPAILAKRISVKKWLKVETISDDELLAPSFQPPADLGYML